MNRTQFKDYLLSKRDQHNAQSLIQRTEAARSIALVSEPNALPTSKLEELRLIHRNDVDRNDPVREQANAFRELRTRLLALGGEQNFVTLVVPISEGCGGSFVARNLAAAFAFDEAKTALLIDCDARDPAQHKALAVDVGNGGLMEYLDDPTLDISEILYPTGVPRLRLMPSGRRRETTSEVFTSFRMRTLVDSLRSHYPDRYLILDGPSVQGSPDARILSDLADFVVLVAGYGRIAKAHIDKAVGNFDPNKLAGIVFNERP